MYNTLYKCLCKCFKNVFIIDILLKHALVEFGIESWEPPSV